MAAGTQVKQQLIAILTPIFAAHDKKAAGTFVAQAAGKDLVDTADYAALKQTVADNKTALEASIKTVSDDLAAFKTLADETYAKKTDIASVYKVKGSVNDITALEAVADPEVGDVYNVVDGGDDGKDGANYVWNGTSWDELGGTYDFSTFVEVTDLTVPTEDEINAIIGVTPAPAP